MSSLNSIILFFVGGWMKVWAQAAGLPGVESLPAIDTTAEFGQPATDFSVLFIKMLFAMIVVISLAFFLLRYILPKLQIRRQQNAEVDIRIIHRVPLNTKNALFILQVEDRRFLIAASDQQASLISELEKNYDPEDKTAAS